MKKHTTVVSFLLDETGSMQAIKDDTVGGFNAYVEPLQKAGADIVFSLVSFNSHETRPRYVAAPIDTIEPLTDDTYRPRALTPLIDAAACRPTARRTPQSSTPVPTWRHSSQRRRLRTGSSCFSELGSTPSPRRTTPASDSTRTGSSRMTGHGRGRCSPKRQPTCGTLPARAGVNSCTTVKTTVVGWATPTPADTST